MSKIKKLQLMADKLRIHSLRSTTAAGSGHPTTCFSCAEIMSCCFFSELRQGDEFVMSKGHAAPILWAAYAESGIIPVKELMNLRKITSNLEGHPTPNMPMIKVATGSLGQGLSAGVGMALAQKLGKEKKRVYVLLGDGEIAEGSVWEAANAASYYKLNNLCAIIDVNRLGQSQPTMHGHNLNTYQKKFSAFGWNTIVINGHNVTEILNALKKSKSSTHHNKPTVIIARTLKGKGISFIENKEGWHGKALKGDQFEKALKELEKPGINSLKLKSDIKYEKVTYKFKNFKNNTYKLGEKIATRSAFGKALVNLGKKNKNAVVIDGDVKNSTMTEEFFKNFPKRSFESFIAEQNMIGMAIGLSARGKIPFAATFSAFLSRAHDFIRMALYSKANIKIMGSHVGVSIGEDGPSQMGLEDINMFLSIPGSVILYPCDAISTEKLVKEMAKHKGISYMRTTREKTPTIYKNSEKFPLGGLKVIKKSKRDKILIIGAGVTLYEALKAHNKLKEKKINTRVIDLYSIQPIDKKALLKNAKECSGNIIVVEDHYFGGIGTVVSEVFATSTNKINNKSIKLKHLYIKEIPRSGKPEELRKRYKIDASAIISAVKQF
jgi:transketolase